MARRQDRDTTFDCQGFVIEAGQVVERRVQQGDIGAAVADVVGAVGGAGDSSRRIALDSAGCAIVRLAAA